MAFRKKTITLKLKIIVKNGINDYDNENNN